MVTCCSLLECSQMVALKTRITSILERYSDSNESKGFAVCLIGSIRSTTQVGFELFAPGSEPVPFSATWSSDSAPEFK